MNPHYQHLEKGYAEWLSILGYADSSVKSLPLHIRELLQYLENRHIHHISLVHNRHLSGFIQQLKQRSNKTYGGGLSSHYINKYIHTIHNFARYLGQSSSYHIDSSLRSIEHDQEPRSILSQSDLLKLYDSTFDPYTRHSIATGQRDRAIIAIFYGCGLRRSEGIALNLYDIDTHKSSLFVRKGKGNKQRRVPIARKHLEDLKAYIQEGRNWYLEAHDTGHYQHQCYGTNFKMKSQTDPEALFLNQWGQRMKDFSYRLEQMKIRAGIAQDFSLHSLRHSIATHLLHSGMNIEEIARFLGHKSLVSTQIYTHILEQQNRQDNASATL
jgi:integrase/recombinase XerD